MEFNKDWSNVLIWSRWGGSFGFSHLQIGRAVPTISKRQNWFKGRELTRRRGSSGPSKMLGKADRYM